MQARYIRKYQDAAVAMIDIFSAVKQLMIGEARRDRFAVAYRYFL